MFSKTAFTVAVLAAISLASATVVQKCPNADEPIFAGIANCEEEPCQLVDNLEMLITFRAMNNSYTLWPKLRAKVGPLTITYPLPGDLANGCNSIVNGNCPIPQGEVVVYHIIIPVDTFPKTAVRVEFSLLGDDGVVFQCFIVNCMVV